MKKYFQAALLFVLTSSCAQKPNLKDIQLTVFGNMPMGVKSVEYNRQFDSLVKNAMSITKWSKYPYFRLDKRSMIDYSITLLYPHTFHNRDSIVTRIVFYVNQVRFFSMEMVEEAKRQGEDERVTRISKENVERLSFLTEDFDTRNGKVDKQFAYLLPNIAQSHDYFKLEKDMTENLEQKYGKPLSTKTEGNEYDSQDYSFFKEILWKSDKLNIRLVKRRFLVNVKEPSTEFNMVLIYEYNDEVRRKYGLNKEVDLTQTF